MKLVVLQSNYIPWKGYFDLLNSADLFVVYDSVQYTKNDWRNRNLIATPNGSTWLTIAVETAGKSAQRISDARISDKRWAKKHWQTISQNYAKSPYFSLYEDQWARAYSHCAEFDLLHDVNVFFLKMIAAQLTIDTQIALDTDFDFDFGGQTPTEKLVELCRATGATTYITGPSGLNYLETERFSEAGIVLESMSYNEYGMYPQYGTTFQHGVSVIDLLVHAGTAASSHLLGNTSRVE